MSMQDLFSDFIARVNNANMISASEVIVLKNKLVTNVSKWMVKYGFFEKFEDHGNFHLKIYLKPKSIKLKRVSKPGKREYVKAGKFIPILDGKGFVILSTSQGIKSTYEISTSDPSQPKIGGEVLFKLIKS